LVDEKREEDEGRREVRGGGFEEFSFAGESV